MANAFVLSIPSVPYAFSFIRPSVEVFAGECGLEEGKISKLVLAAEEVFSYCCKLASKSAKKEPIQVSFQLEPNRLGIVLEYIGPQGTLEKRLSPSGSGVISRDSFDALGLYIAKQAVESLQYQYTFDGTNRYSLYYAKEIPKSLLSRLRFID